MYQCLLLLELLLRNSHHMLPQLPEGQVALPTHLKHLLLQQLHLSSIATARAARAEGSTLLQCKKLGHTRQRGKLH